MQETELGLASRHFSARDGELVYLDSLIDFVYLVHLVDEQNKPDKLDKRPLPLASPPLTHQYLL